MRTRTILIALALIFGAVIGTAVAQRNVHHDDGVKTGNVHHDDGLRSFQ